MEIRARFKRGRSKSGQAPLMIILMAVAFTISAYVLINSYTSVRSNLVIRSQDEKLQIENMLMDSVDCIRTLEQIALVTEEDLDTKCSNTLSAQVPPFVPLVNSDGDVVTQTYDSVNGYGDIGDWSFRASCFRDGANVCLLVHAGRPWKGGEVGGQQFKTRALGSTPDDWKKMPRAPWPTPGCCLSTPGAGGCTLTVTPNPVGQGTPLTLSVTANGATSVTFTTNDPDPVNQSKTVPIAEGSWTFTPNTTGTFQARATVQNVAGTADCLPNPVTYDVVQAPACTLGVLTPSGPPHGITFGQTANLQLTWTNTTTLPPTISALVAIFLPPVPETQIPISIPIPLPTVAIPARNIVVTPPMGRTDQGLAGYRVRYRAQIGNTTGSTYCDSPELEICPLGASLSLYQFQNPSGNNCTTCDLADFLKPNASYLTMTHGFGISTTDTAVPNLVPIYQNNSATKADYWTGRTNLGPAFEGYGTPVAKFWAFASQNEAPGLIPVALWKRSAGLAHPPYSMDTQQDAVLFPNDASRFAAIKAGFEANGYSKVSENEFYACPLPGNYVPTP